MLDLLVQVLYHLRTHVVRHSAVIHRDQNRHLLPVTPKRHRPRPQMLRDSLRLRLPHRVPAQPNRIIRRDVNLRDANLPQRFLLRCASSAKASYGANSGQKDAACGVSAASASVDRVHGSGQTNGEPPSRNRTAASRTGLGLRGLGKGYWQRSRRRESALTSPWKWCADPRRRLRSMQLCPPPWVSITRTRTKTRTNGTSGGKPRPAVTHPPARTSKCRAKAPARRAAPAQPAARARQRRARAQREGRGARRQDNRPDGPASRFCLGWTC